MRFDNFDKLIGVVNVDLFVPVFTHVFGEAQQGGRFALVSLFRLGEKAEGVVTPSASLLGRTAKVALHELGHLFDLFHCSDRRCLMHFSGGLEDLDEIPSYFCRYCSIFLKDSISR